MRALARMTRREFLAAAGFTLAGLLLGDSLVEAAGARPQAFSKATDGMVLIPEGPFLMGTSEAEARHWAKLAGYDPSWILSESPQREVVLKAYFLDKYPVTNRQYAEFVKATGHAPPQHWRGKTPPARLLEHPVVFVSREDARAYVAWCGKRLPTEAEWEKAARGTDGRTFPWGNDFDPARCCWHRNAALGRTTCRVDAHPAGASPWGVMDMVGNVLEWCNDAPPGSDSTNDFLLATCKGGFYEVTHPISLRAACRLHSGFALNKLSYVGFRCAKDVA